MPISWRVRASCRVDGLTVFIERGKRDEGGVCLYGKEEKEVLGRFEDAGMKDLGNE